MIKEPETYTPIQKFRLSADMWKRFGEAAGPRNRSAVLAQFVRWYLRDGPMPKRPAEQPDLGLTRVSQNASDGADDSDSPG